MVTLMIDESENYYKIDNAFNVTEEKNISWKGSNDKVVCSHCGKSSHTKEKYFQLIFYPTHWEDRRTCFKCNETKHVARDFPKNDEDRNIDEK